MPSFVDPIHNVIKISGKDTDTLALFEPAMDRLKKISQLGWVEERFPGARHSKWEHAVGCFHLANVTTAFRRKIADLDSHHLRIASALHVIGQPPLSYSTTRGVMMAVQSSSEVKSSLMDLMRMISEKVATASGNEKIGSRVSSENLDESMIQRWLAVKTVMDTAPDRDEGKLLVDVTRYLLDPNHLGFRFVNLFHTLDYVLRDLYYTGIANLRINYDLILEPLASARTVEDFDTTLAGLAEWGVVESIEELLKLQVYWDEKVLAIESLFAKMVAKAIVDGYLDIESLITYDDHSLREKIFSSGYRDQYNFDIPSVTQSYRTVFKDEGYSYPVGMRWQQLEAGIVEKAGFGSITYPIDTKTLLVAEPSGPGSPEFLFRIRVLWQLGSGRLRPLIDILAGLQQKADVFSLRPSDPFSYGEATIGALFSRFPSVVIGRSALNGFAKYLESDLDTIREGLRRGLKKRALRRGLVKVSVGGEELEISPSFPIRVLFSLFERPPIEALRDLAGHIVTHVNDFKIEFLRKICGGMSEYFEVTKDPGVAEAIALFAEVLGSRSEKIAWSLPNVTCLTRTGEVSREIDVVTLFVHESDKSAHVRLIECTARGDPGKSVADAKKLVELKQEVEDRFEDVEVETQVYGLDPRVGFDRIEEALSGI